MGIEMVPANAMLMSVTETIFVRNSTVFRRAPFMARHYSSRTIPEAIKETEEYTPPPKTKQELNKQKDSLKRIPEKSVVFLDKDHERFIEVPSAIRIMPSDSPTLEDGDTIVFNFNTQNK